MGLFAIFVNRAPPGSRMAPFVIDETTLAERCPLLSEAVWKAAMVATHTRSVAASLFNGLNEEQTFPDAPGQYFNQDMLKARSWRNFLETGAVEPERMVDLPMVKSAVRGMDTITNFTSSFPSGAVTRFAVWGYSKLGSATLMTGAVDPRV